MIQDTERVVRWYKAQVDGLRAGAALSAASQRRRHEILCELGDFDGRTVLDMSGAGGAFYAFLRERGCRPLYTGVDLSEESTAACRARFSGDDACRFETGGVLDYQPAAPYDYVVASGFFGLKTEDGAPITSHALTRLFSWCTMGAAVNFLSLRSLGAAARSQRADPAATLKTALRLTPAVRVRHDYLPDDFTVFLYRTPAWEADRAQRSNP